jgi:hypothetical protein
MLPHPVSSNIQLTISRREALPTSGNDVHTRRSYGSRKTHQGHGITHTRIAAGMRRMTVHHQSAPFHDTCILRQARPIAICAKTGTLWPPSFTLTHSHSLALTLSHLSQSLEHSVSNQHNNNNLQRGLAKRTSESRTASAHKCREPFTSKLHIVKICCLIARALARD